MATRRPSQFWAEFNEWARTVKDDPHLKLTTQAVVEWWTANAEHVWPDAELRPTLQDARRHAKGIRSKTVLRQYFRDYRLRRKSAGLGPKVSAPGKRKADLADANYNFEGHGAIAIQPKTKHQGTQRTRCKPKRFQSPSSETDTENNSSDKWATDDSDWGGQDHPDASKPSQAEEHSVPPDAQPGILPYYMLPTNPQERLRPQQATHAAMSREVAGVAYRPRQSCGTVQDDPYDQNHGPVSAALGPSAVKTRPGAMPRQPLHQVSVRTSVARVEAQGRQALQGISIATTDNKGNCEDDLGTRFRASLPKSTGDPTPHPQARQALSSVSNAPVNTRSDDAAQGGNSGQPVINQSSTAMIRAPTYVAGVTLPGSIHGKPQQGSARGKALAGRKRVANSDQHQEFGYMKSALTAGGLQAHGALEDDPDCHVCCSSEAPANERMCGMELQTAQVAKVRCLDVPVDVASGYVRGSLTHHAQETLDPEMQRRVHATTVRPGGLGPVTYLSGGLAADVSGPPAVISLGMLPQGAYSAHASSVNAKLNKYALPNAYSDVRQPTSAAVGSPTDIGATLPPHNDDVKSLGAPLCQQTYGEIDAAEQEAMLIRYCLLDEEFDVASGELPEVAPATIASTLPNGRAQQHNGEGATFPGIRFPAGGYGFIDGLQYAEDSKKAPVPGTHEIIPFNIKEEPGTDGQSRNWAALMDTGATDACEGWNGWMPEPNLVMQLPPLQPAYPYHSERQQDAAKVYEQWQPFNMVYYPSETAAGPVFYAAPLQPWEAAPCSAVMPTCCYPSGPNPHYAAVGAAWNPQDATSAYGYQ